MIGDKKMEKNEDLELKDLESYTGSEKLYRVMGVNITDGVKYVMENGYSWFVTDAIAVIKEKFKNEPFLSIHLSLEWAKYTYMEISDGNGHLLYSYRYKYTPAKREITLFYVDNILMLRGEY